MDPGNRVVWTVQWVDRMRWGILNHCWRAEARLRGVELVGRVRFNGRPCLARVPGSRIVLSEGVILNSALRSNPIGCARPATLRTMRPGAEIIFERDAGISASVVCAAVRIHIGEGTIIGADTMLLDNDFHSPEGEWGWGWATPGNPRPILIGRGVFIGARALVLKGVTIGDRAVIGAGAVITKDVPPRHLAVGNPARILPLNAPPTRL